MGKKEDQSQRDYTMMKHAFLAGMITLAIFIAPIVRGAFFKTSSTDYTDRILRLEVQNTEHVRLAKQLDNQATISDGLQIAQAQLIAQVKILAEVVSVMQQREFARLEDRRSGL